MDDKHNKADKSYLMPTRKVLVGVVAVALALLITLFIYHLVEPKRSIVEYCKVYKQEKVRLEKLPGDTYPSAVFDDSLSDASEIAASLDKIQKVAPVDIRPDVKSLEAVYKNISDDPSHAISASISGVSAEDNVKSWTLSHCSN